MRKEARRTNASWTRGEREYLRSKAERQLGEKEAYGRRSVKDLSPRQWVILLEPVRVVMEEATSMGHEFMVLNFLAVAERFCRIIVLRSVTEDVHHVIEQRELFIVVQRRLEEVEFCPEPVHLSLGLVRAIIGWSGGAHPVLSGSREAGERKRKLPSSGTSCSPRQGPSVDFPRTFDS